MAAVAAGTDALIIEVHPDPVQAMVDGAQALSPEDFISLAGDLRKLHEFIAGIGAKT